MSLHPAGTRVSWVMVMPVKNSATAKSRLLGLAGDQRADLALAFATDCARAALGTKSVGAVLAVTDDPVAVGRLGHIGCSTVRDDPRDGLNAAVQYGVDVARARWPGTWVAVLPSDLPALRPADLAEALFRAQKHPRAFVPDAAGVGTNLLSAGPGLPLDPRFEGSSCAAHAATGAARLDIAAPGLRRDVDDRASLCDARELGLGPATRAVLARLERLGDAYDEPMQATVASYDDQTRSGTVLTDEGVALSFTAAALEDSRLRLLRPGQRVRIDVGAQGGIDRLQIVTLAG